MAVMDRYWLGVFRRACGKPHTRADNKQLWKSTMFFWNKKVLFEISLKMFQYMKRSFKNNFRREKQVARSFRNFVKFLFIKKELSKSFCQNVSEISVLQQRCLRKFLETLCFLQSCETTFSCNNKANLVLVENRLSLFEHSPDAQIFFGPKCPSSDWIRFCN